MLLAECDCRLLPSFKDRLRRCLLTFLLLFFFACFFSHFVSGVLARASLAPSQPLTDLMLGNNRRGLLTRTLPPSQALLFGCWSLQLLFGIVPPESPLLLGPGHSLSSKLTNHDQEALFYRKPGQLSKSMGAQIRLLLEEKLLDELVGGVTSDLPCDLPS